MKSSHECSNHVAHGRRRACAQEPYRWQPSRLLRPASERRKNKESDKDREPDPLHGRRSGGWLAGV